MYAYTPLFATVSQIARPHNTSLIRVFAEDEMDKVVYSVDVSTSTSASYSGMTLNIEANVAFHQNRTYYLEADQGVCVCACMCVCVCCVCGVCVCFVWCHVCVGSSEGGANR